MAYLGIQSQIRHNNRNSVLLLIAFPILLLAVVYAILYFTIADKLYVKSHFFSLAPLILLGVALWFVIAFYFNVSIVQIATGARPLQRKENMRVYNLVENLCISQGMLVPEIFILEDESLNAYASGINNKSFAITLSQGIIQKLNDAELEGVIAHELAHIRNRDVRLLIVSIVFVGIFAFLSEMAFRLLFQTNIGRSRSKGDKGAGGAILIVAVVVTAIAYFLSMLLRFGISRSREYIADAGAAEMTRNPLALASALKKIQEDPFIEAVKNHDVAQLFIEYPANKEDEGFSINRLFATHPPISKRIKILEGF